MCAPAGRLRAHVAGARARRVRQVVERPPAAGVIDADDDARCRWRKGTRPRATAGSREKRGSGVAVQQPSSTLLSQGEGKERARRSADERTLWSQSEQESYTSGGAASQAWADAVGAGRTRDAAGGDELGRSGSNRPVVRAGAVAKQVLSVSQDEDGVSANRCCGSLSGCPGKWGRGWGRSVSLGRDEAPGAVTAANHE